MLVNRRYNQTVPCKTEDFLWQLGEKLLKKTGRYIIIKVDFFTIKPVCIYCIAVLYRKNYKNDLGRLL